MNETINKGTAKRMLIKQAKWLTDKCEEHLAKRERDLFLRQVGGLIEIVGVCEMLDIDYPNDLLQRYYKLQKIQQEMIFGWEKIYKED